MSVVMAMPLLGQAISDEQLIKEAVAAKSSGASESDIATQLMKKGATMDQIQRIRGQYAQQITKRGLDNTVDNAIGDAQRRMRTNNEPNDNAITTSEGALAPDYVPEALSPSGRRVFGRDIFNNKRLSFEPQMNIATPQNYVLGPGDQLVIDIYGATQENMKLTVSPDGDVTIPYYGPIHVSGLSVASAQQTIRNKLGGYYESSDIKTTLGQTRTIMVNVMGEVRVPGTYTLSAFATVFHALYMAGGISSLVRSAISRCSVRDVLLRSSMSMSSFSMAVWPATSACRTTMSSRWAPMTASLTFPVVSSVRWPTR